MRAGVLNPSLLFMTLSLHIIIAGFLLLKIPGLVAIVAI
ncbi:hypothetical protein BN126_1458 [Cronobacter sakazakii 680]|uniref:Uncharacterized protein n=1 Tax=Cronobacter sakazakii (strain ATCC BAA-894) TaxID=290339 RepID=A7MNG4_CROS8|nr:hypothetical protein ESA_03819 [Cronobacter sakazakii ATCC BAA-894]CCK04752.1 hypothetical protein BN129_3542 [Cronobacter sakazakii 701]CCK09166.1 hypothetical protein BN128_3282 [Cronobacter sakazakii 696]CCK11299.1 hypothetical protein BN126_1458 [Cronobacter sakazakii 680]